MNPVEAEVNVDILFRSWSHLSGAIRCHRPQQYIGQITQCIVPIIPTQNYSGSPLVNPLYRIRDPSGDERFLEFILQGPNNRTWHEQWRQLKDLTVGGSLIYLRPSYRFTKFRSGDIGFCLSQEDLDPLRVIILPFDLQKSLHLVRRILYFRGRMCWSPECKRVSIPSSEQAWAMPCGDCGIAVYCDGICKREDSIHGGLCESGKLDDLDRLIRDAMDAYARDLRRFLGDERVEEIKTLHRM